MTTLILDGYIVKEKTDDGKMFYFTGLPERCGESEFGCGKQGDLCFDFDAPIKEYLIVGNPTKCKITIEIDN